MKRFARTYARTFLRSAVSCWIRMLIEDFLSVLHFLRTTFARREMLCVTSACLTMGCGL